MKERRKELSEMFEPEFFDLFGLIVFSILLILGISLRKIARKRALVIIGIGIIGLIVDSYNVLTSFILN